MTFAEFKEHWTPDNWSAAALRKEAGLTQAQFAEAYGMPKRTLENWEGSKNTAPEYVQCLLTYAVKTDLGKI